MGELRDPASDDDRVHAVAAATGERLWRYRTGGNVVARPTLSNGLALIGSADNVFYALDLAAHGRRARASASVR